MYQTTSSSSSTGTAAAVPLSPFAAAAVAAATVPLVVHRNNEHHLPSSSMIPPSSCFDPHLVFTAHDHNNAETYRYSFPQLTSPSYFDLLRQWNYHRSLSLTSKNGSIPDSHSRKSSFHRLSSSNGQKQIHPIQQIDPYEQNDLLKKFHHQTMVTLETGEAKKIQNLTTNDLLTSAKQSPHYSSLLARVDYIGNVDSSTGKAELRFFILDIEKMISYHVQQEMPFFVQQYSSWSSISPSHTEHRCGLICRQLECGDVILAITEQRKKSNRRINTPDYHQQSPTKSFVNRFRVSSNKRYKITSDE